ncbi:MAG: hypothetical protein KF802_13920 [Bdellovibrionaceae bacterium]|nr:hypothetical protein [Pseudobdellovibrionaceae bacterium]MBX3033125.1 hypothetical protein [Pseudobdellovibrionaceae bacterium]
MRARGCKRRFLMAALMVAAPFFAAQAAAPVCASVFGPSGGMIQAFENSASWLGPKAAQRLSRRLQKHLDQGSLSTAQITGLERLMRRLSLEKALDWRKALRSDLHGMREELARGQMSSEQLAAEITRLAREENLLRDSTRVERALLALTTSSNLRSLSTWGAVHLSLNVASLNFLGQAMLEPLYFASLNLRLLPEQINRLADESARVGFPEAFRRMENEVKGRLDAQIGYQFFQRGVNLIIAAFMIEWIINDLPGELNQAKVESLLRETDRQAESMKDLLIAMNTEMIQRYRERLTTVKETPLREAIMAEIQRLNEQIESFQKGE